MSRRHLMVAGAGTAVGITIVAGCGGGSADPATDSATSAASGSGADGVLAQLADIPVGSAVSATDASGKPVIVAQPTEGKVVCFSAICTHQGCTVAPAGAIIKCPCHGSTYDLATGDNTGGPAPSPLTEITVKIEQGAVVEG